MKIVDIREARKHLLKLVNEAAKGNAFIIAKSGRPMVKVVPFNRLVAKRQRVGFLKNHLNIPDDFDPMGEAEIERLFSDPL